MEFYGIKVRCQGPYPEVDDFLNPKRAIKLTTQLRFVKGVIIVDGLRRKFHQFYIFYNYLDFVKTELLENTILWELSIVLGKSYGIYIFFFNKTIKVDYEKEQGF